MIIDNNTTNTTHRTLTLDNRITLQQMHGNEQVMEEQFKSDYDKAVNHIYYYQSLVLAIILLMLENCE